MSWRREAGTAARYAGHRISQSFSPSAVPISGLARRATPGPLFLLGLSLLFLLRVMVRRLSHHYLYYMLLALTVAASVATFIAFCTKTSGDQRTYIGYAEGLLQTGRYSYWYYLPDYLPDTFRNPGYPLFIAAIYSLTQNMLLLRLLQLGMYFACIWLALDTLRPLDAPGSYLSRNVFLLLLLPNVQGAYFAAVVYPEILVMLLVMLYFRIATTRPVAAWSRVVLLALLLGAIVQVRPVFLFFPLVQVAYDWLWRRPEFRVGPAVAYLLLFGLTTLPYAFWNLRHHHVFKLTSLEGGGGVMQIGFWAFRMPNYEEQHYWHNTMGDEVVQFVEPAEVPTYIRAFNQEWAEINRQSAPFMSHEDSVYGPQMRQRIPQFFPTYSAAYTMQREKLLVHYTVQHILAEPAYYAKTRLYTLVRLWVTGLQRRDWVAATTPLSKLKVLYPALVSGLAFLLAIVAIPWALVRHRLLQHQAFMLALLLVLYVGVLHLPFAIQARYTVPVRLLLFLCTAYAISKLLEGGASRVSPVAQPANRAVA